MITQGLLLESEQVRNSEIQLIGMTEKLKPQRRGHLEIFGNGFSATLTTA